MKYFFLLFLSFSLSAQIKGVVKDSISGEPISYVNIWVENETIGTTSEANGSFSLDIKEEKMLVFSALGYEIKKISSKEETIYLRAIAYELNEIIIQAFKNSSQLEIGRVKNNGFYGVDNLGPVIRAKYFPFEEKYKETKFLKEIMILTKSELDSASFKLRIFNIGKDGFPDKDLVDEDIIVYVKKGKIKAKIDVSKYQLEMPDNGLFVAFENLLIKSNEHIITIQNNATKKSHNATNYYPYIKHNFVDREYTFSFYGGKWRKQYKYKYTAGSDDLKVFEPAITLILTN